MFFFVCVFKEKNIDINLTLFIKLFYLFYYLGSVSWIILITEYNINIYIVDTLEDVKGSYNWQWSSTLHDFKVVSTEVPWKLPGWWIKSVFCISASFLLRLDIS